MRLKALLCAFFVIGSLVVATPVSALDTRIVVTGISKDNRYIIQGKNGSLKHVIQSFTSAQRLFGDFAVVVADVDEVQESLEASGQRFGSVVISPDQRKHKLTTPNDTFWSNLWGLGLDSNYGIDLLAAHDLFTTKQPGEDAVVAILDTGYTVHPDLANSYIGGYDFIGDFQPTTYCDVSNSNDGNGRDSDPSDAGDWWGPYSSSWHGTHVHGTIAAEKNNNAGVVGVAPFAKVLHGRVLGSCGGYDSEIALAIRWAAGLSVTGIPTNTTPADVINMSLGGTGTCSSVFQSAITAARDAGTVVVVAAGNENVNASNSSPGNCNNVITVAATGPEGYRAYYSNYGSTVDIAAPGGDFNYGASGGIASTLNTGTTTPGSPTYAYYQGTSMATPHVTGIVALIRSANPDLTASQVESILLSSVNSFRSDSAANSCSLSNRCGSGLVDAQKAVAAALATLGGGGVTDTQVQSPVATIESSRTTISWSAPSNTTNLTGYEVSVAGLRNKCVNSSSQLSCTFTRLKNGQSYTATIQAKYGSTLAVGITLTFIPAGRPSGLSLSRVTSTTGALTPLWVAANDNGSPVTGYRAEALFSDGSVAGFCVTTSLSCTISGLSTGMSYRLKLTATNAAGSSSITSRLSYRVR